VLPDAADHRPAQARHHARRRDLVYAALVIEGGGRCAVPGCGDDDDVRRELLSSRHVGQPFGLGATARAGPAVTTRAPGAPSATRPGARTAPRSPGTPPRRSP